MEGGKVPALQEALPKFVQIANHIRSKILSGQLSPGDEAPSERAIAAEWKVARPTAARAVQLLRTQGLVTSRQGAGTVVQDPRLYRTAQDRYRRARSTGTTYPDDEWAEIVSARLTKPPAQIAEVLGLPPGEKAVRRHRITRTSDGPLELSTSWFRPELGEAAPRLLTRERIREGTLAYVEACTGRRARFGRDEMSARLATDEEASALDLQQPAAVLVVHHLACDAGGQTIEAAEAVFPPGRRTAQQEYQLAD